ncbi:MAG: hypothetical protein J7K23_02565 [Thermoproteales archaeon]|nr:hypothetical protein [Thermoproteales archaeon]
MRRYWVLVLCYFFLLSSFSSGYGFSVSPASESVFVRGTVYDAETGQPIEGVLVEYYMVCWDESEHWGYPIDYAVTDSNGKFVIRLDKVEQQIGSSATYSLDFILSHGFMLISYKEGYIRGYFAVNLSKPEYYFWSPHDKEKGVKVINIYMYKNLPLKEIKRGSITARYYFDYQRAAAIKLMHFTSYYIGILKKKLGVGLENKNIIIEFNMGVKTLGVGSAHASVVEANHVTVNWYPWITDPLNEKYFLLLVHEFVHLFQDRVNSKNVILSPASPWFTEGQAVAISKAVLYEEGKGGLSFEQQAYDDSVGLPEGFEDFIDPKSGTNYAKWGKMFSLIVLEAKKEDESVWDFITRFMRILDEFVEKDSVGYMYNGDKLYTLSDYETILVLSLAACKNLTDLFVQTFNFPAELLSIQRLAYLKFLKAREYLNKMSYSWQGHGVFLDHFKNGIFNFLKKRYGVALSEFNICLNLVNWSGKLPDPLSTKCFVFKIPVIVVLNTKYTQNEEKYEIFIDKEKMYPSERIVWLTRGDHLIQVYFGKAKILEKHVKVDESSQSIEINVEEHLLTLELPDKNLPKNVTIIKSCKIIDSYNVTLSSLKIALPEGRYVIIVESPDRKWLKSINLNTDIFGRVEKWPGQLFLYVKDRYGNPRNIMLVFNGKKIHVNGSIRIYLPYGVYKAEAYWNKIPVWKGMIDFNHKDQKEVIILDFYNLNIRTVKNDNPLPNSVIEVYFNDILLAKNHTGSSGRASFKLPKGDYKIRISYRDKVKEHRVSLTNDKDLCYSFDEEILPFTEYFLITVPIILLTCFIYYIIRIKRGVRR